MKLISPRSQFQMHPLLQERLNAIRDAFMAHYKGGGGLPKESNGNDREFFVDNFLSKVFPPHLRVLSGTLIDSMSLGHCGQIDSAIVLPNAPSFVMPGGKEYLMLAENVAVVFEVKSDLSTQWEEVKKKTAMIRNLRKHIKDLESPGHCVVTNVPIYAFGFKGWSNVNSLKKKFNETAEQERPDGVLMLENPAFVGKNLVADKDGALFAFILEINDLIRSHMEIHTDLMRYINTPVMLPD